MEHFNELSPPHLETLALLAEECAEVIQIVNKIIRHGMDSYHPDSNAQNFDSLQREVGDVMAALRLAETYRIIDWARVIKARDSKIARVGEYLHHASFVQD